MTAAVNGNGNGKKIMRLIDTHCHLTDLSEEEVDVTIAEAEQAFVTRMICIGATKGLESVERAVAIAESRSNVWATVGFHPHDADKFSDAAILKVLAQSDRVVAIGETGLDFYRDWSDKSKQYELFRSSIRLAKELNKPLVIHSRAAEEETIKVLKQENADEVGGVFHCYAGTADFASRLEQMNFRVSLTGILTFRSANTFRDEVRKIPLNQILLETDSPYMAPEPVRGSPSSPKHVYRIAEMLGEVKGIGIEAVAAITTGNAEKLFRLS